MDQDDIKDLYREKYQKIIGVPFDEWQEKWREENAIGQFGFTSGKILGERHASRRAATAWP